MPDDKTHGPPYTKLSSMGLFHLGQQNPSNINSFASVAGIGERPPLSFVAGCSSLFVMAPRGRVASADASDQCKYDWKQVDTADKCLLNSHILAIAVTVCNTLRDTVWLMVGYAQVQQATRKPHISIIKFDRNDFNASDPQVKGSVTHTEPLDFWPITIKAYGCGDHTGFLISGSDNQIHVRMLVRHTVYSSFYEISNPLKLDKIVFLRHLINVKSVVLSMDFYLGETYDLWATGCQDGWLQLWYIPEDSETRMASVLLNGPISSLCFFTVSHTDRHERIKKNYEELSSVLHRAAAAEPPAAPCEFDTCDNLLVAEASGRAIVFWNVGRYGLNCPDVLPSPPLAGGSQVPSMSRCSSEVQFPAPTKSVSVSSAPALSTPTSSRTDKAEVRSNLRSVPSMQTLAPTPTPMENAGTAVSCSSSPDVSLDTPLRRSPKKAEPRVDDGGLLGTGVLCVHASDITGDGVCELLIGTYSKALVVYRLNTKREDAADAADGCELGSLFDVKPEHASRRPPWRYEVARVRYFPYQLHSIHTAESSAEATNTLQILTAYHLHVVGPDVRQVRQQVQRRLSLVQQILELEQRCGGQRAETAHADADNADDADSRSNSSSSTLGRDEPCPTWIMDRFQLGR